MSPPVSDRIIEKLVDVLDRGTFRIISAFRYRADRSVQNDLLALARNKDKLARDAAAGFQVDRDRLANTLEINTNRIEKKKGTNIWMVRQHDYRLAYITDGSYIVLCYVGNKPEKSDRRCLNRAQARETDYIRSKRELMSGGK